MASARKVKQQLGKLARFVAKREAEKETKIDLLDTEYWVSIVFETREQVEAFTRALGPGYGGKYIDGLALADQLGIDVGPRQEFPRERPFSRRLLELAREVPPPDDDA